MMHHWIDVLWAPLFLGSNALSFWAARRRAKENEKADLLRGRAYVDFLSLRGPRGLREVIDRLSEEGRGLHGATKTELETLKRGLEAMRVEP
jgi:hypothetical protein